MSNIKKGDIQFFSSLILNKVFNNKEKSNRKNSNSSDRPNFSDEENDSDNNNESNNETKEIINSKIENIYDEYKKIIKK